MNRIPSSLTIAQAEDLMAKRELSSVELTEMLLQRIDEMDPHLNAFITVTAERAMEQARAADSKYGQPRSPMQGIPFGLKDIYNTAGIKTTAHSKLLIDNVPSEESTASARLNDAGAVLMGKLATHEFAHGGPSFQLPWPPARNPWNRAHFTGGSSTGSGAAVASGLVLGALGSDTGGSVRNPAALCGIVGMKPTYGLVSRYGVIPNSFTFDTCGPMAWTVEDSAIMLQVIAGHDPRDPTSSSRPIPNYRANLSDGIRGLRLGVIRHFWEDDLPANDEVRQSMEAALSVLEDLGAILEPVNLRPMQDYCDVKIIIGEAELYAIHEADLIRRSGDFCDDFLGRSLPAILIGAKDYVQAQRERQRMLAEMESVYQRYDALVTAGFYGPAPKLGSYQTVKFFWQNSSITIPYNVLGCPAISICNGYTESGLPLSMQIAGRPFDEATVFRVASAYELATPWWDRRPVLDFSNDEPLEGTSGQPAWQEKCEDPLLRDKIHHLVQAANLSLTDEQFEQICDAAPFVKARIERLHNEFRREDEPASTFSFK